MGLMLLFLGIIGSSRYSVEENISLPINEPKEALGYKLTYKGATPIKGDEEKFHFNVIVEKDGRAFLLQPVMYYSAYSDGIMKNPDIANLLTKDLYLSPMALEVPEEYSSNEIHTLGKGEETDINGMKVKFIDFDRSMFYRDDMSADNNIMGAELEVIIDGKKEKVIAQQKISQGMSENIPVKMSSDNRFTFYLVKLSVSGESTIDIAVVDDSIQKELMPETLVLTASIKPFINLVWGGTVVIVLGFFLSLLARYRRLKSESRKSSVLNSNGDVNSNGKNHNEKRSRQKLTENN
jgi:cytochrome c-type biogenesis protein CcmF